MSSAPPVAEQLDLMRDPNRRLERENDLLAERNGELDTQLQDLTRKLELYEEQVAWLKNRRYGRGTEKLSDAERQQLRLFDEIESGGAGGAGATGADPEGAGPTRGCWRSSPRPSSATRCRLYCQERQFARLGIELSRRTMSDWMIAAATACEPIFHLKDQDLDS